MDKAQETTFTDYNAPSSESFTLFVLTLNSSNPVNGNQRTVDFYTNNLTQLTAWEKCTELCCHESYKFF
jgi:hypothetical protein